VADEIGSRCGVVHGEQPADERADVLRRFRAGELDAVANVFVLSEGFDDPAVSVCILARKPAHAGTFLQMVGRVLRPAPGKTHATLVDLCGSVFGHGPPDLEREYSLDGEAISGVAREAIRQCPTCGGVFAAGVTACPLCGEALPVKEMALPRSVGTGVSEVDWSRRPQPRWSRTFAARFPGRCSRCQAPILVGESITWCKGELPTHDRCPAVLRRYESWLERRKSTSVMLDKLTPIAQEDD
jgi:hypothetical protein